MNIKNVLEEEKLLLEAGIKVPKESKAAKIILHADTEEYK